MCDPTRLKVQPASRTAGDQPEPIRLNSAAFWTSVSEPICQSVSRPGCLPVSCLVSFSNQSVNLPTPRLALAQSPLLSATGMLFVVVCRGTKLGCGGSWRSSLLHFTSPCPLLGKQICAIIGSGLMWLWLWVILSSGSCSACCPPPWRSERSHTRQTSDRAASGKPWPNYCNPSDCFNLLHNMFSVTGHTHHVVSSSSSDHRPEDSAAATHVAWPGMVGPGHFPPPPYYSERGLPGGGQGRVVAGGCWEESPEQAVTTLFLETLFLLAARYGQGGRAWRLHKK